MPVMFQMWVTVHVWQLGGLEGALIVYFMWLSQSSESNDTSVWFMKRDEISQLKGGRLNNIDLANTKRDLNKGQS